MAASPDDAWLGGLSHQEQSTFLDHWDGSGWQAVELPVLDRLVSFAGLAPVSSDDVWLAGSIRTADGSLVPQMLHWNGIRWRLS